MLQYSLLRHLVLVHTRTQCGKPTFRARFMQHVHNALAVQSDVGVDVFITAPQTRFEVHLPTRSHGRAVPCDPVQCALCMHYSWFDPVHLKSGLRFALH